MKICHLIRALWNRLLSESSVVKIKPCDGIKWWVDRGYTVVDDRKTELQEIDLREILLINGKHWGEILLYLEDRRKRLASMDVTQLGADVLFSILKNRHKIPWYWKVRCGREYPAFPLICFEGTMLEKEGHQFVLALDIQNEYEVSCRSVNLGCSTSEQDFSAVLQKK
jgi:hypothetical protein